MPNENARVRRARRQLAPDLALMKCRDRPDCYSIVNARLNAVLFHYHEVPLDRIEGFLAT